MTQLADVAIGRDVVARWCNLAERRLEYLTELFETGRWRRFHSELAFLENIQEAKAAVETWRDLMTREATLDNVAIDMTWINRARSASPRGDGNPEPAQRPHARPLPMPAEPLPRDIPGEVLIALESQLMASDDAPSAPDAPAFDDMPLPALDLDAMQDRYPLLRNAL
jgi:uncharacterized repeat protein (TIGR03809 family)